MNDFINQTIALVNSHRGIAITAGVVLAVAIVSVVAARIWAGYRGRTLSARASAGFTVVQSAVAYVTITGGYEFWHRPDRVGMPGPEAALFAAFIEAVTWATVSMIFAHGDRPDSEGFGPAAPLFWISTIGGGIIAIAGSPTFAIATGRSVVVILGAAMWHLRLVQRTHRTVTATRWTITPGKLMLHWGWKLPDDNDVTYASREWQVRSLTRATGKVAEGGRVSKWLGKRTIRTVTEAGDAAMVRDAQARYARGYVLRTEIDLASPSMKAAIDAARIELRPPAPTVPAVDPAPAADVPPAVTLLPARPAPRRTSPEAPRRTGAASAARTDRAAAAALKSRAVDEAVDEMRMGRQLTGKEWGARFGNGEEWGRQRLIEARAVVDADRAPTPVG